MAVIGVGELLSRPVNREIGVAPVNLKAQAITLPFAFKKSVSGWMAKGKPGSGVVLLLHGVRSDRRQMLGRAIALHEEGFSVVLIDLPAHGESDGDRITFGHRESQAVQSALHFIHKTFPKEKVGVIGVSLGAASLILADLPREPDAVVLESMYPSIEEAVANRIAMHVGAAEAVLTPLLLWQFPVRLQISPEELRPVDKLPDWHCPVFIASGAKDLHTTQEETKRIFGRANHPKELWIVSEAGHVDLYRFATSEYEKKIFVFLQKHLWQGRISEHEKVAFTRNPMDRQ